MDIITTQQCIFIVLYVEPKIWIRNDLKGGKNIEHCQFHCEMQSEYMYFLISQNKFTISMIFDHFTVMNTTKFVIKFEETKFIRTN